MFDKVSRSLKYDSNIFFVHKHMDTTTDHFTQLALHVRGNDHRNIIKVGAAHYPGICCAAAILLKERNHEMCGLQSLVSLIMYTCHAEKQVCK